jgi:hypothetical protein
MISPGYFYSVNIEELRRFMNLTAEEKLRWLKKANNTINHLPLNIKKLHKKFTEHHSLSLLNDEDLNTQTAKENQ